MNKAMCEHCGQMFKTGGDRYKQRPAKYCGDRCNQRAYAAANRRIANPTTAAWTAALEQLRRAHLREFGQLLQEEEASRGLEPAHGFQH